MVDRIFRIRSGASSRLPKQGLTSLYAPGLTTREEIEAVVRAVAPKPVNVVMGLSGPSFSLDVLASLGVKRVSLGSSLARAAYGAFLQAAREVKQRGTFDFARNGGLLCRNQRDVQALRCSAHRSSGPARITNQLLCRIRALRRCSQPTTIISSSEIVISIVAAAAMVRLMLSLMPANICRGSVR